MTQSDEFGPLVDGIRAAYPLAQITVDVLPSGYVWCDIELGRLWIEVQFEPGLGYGVSVFDDEHRPIPFTAPDHFFALREPALNFIIAALKPK